MSTIEEKGFEAAWEEGRRIGGAFWSELTPETREELRKAMRAARRETERRLERVELELGTLRAAAAHLLTKFEEDLGVDPEVAAAEADKALSRFSAAVRLAMRVPIAGEGPVLPDVTAASLEESLGAFAEESIERARALFDEERDREEFGAALNLLARDGLEAASMLDAQRPEDPQRVTRIIRAAMLEATRCVEAGRLAADAFAEEVAS